MPLNVYSKGNLSIKKFMIELKAALPHVVLQSITKIGINVNIVTQDSLTPEESIIMQSLIDNHVASIIRKVMDAKYTVTEKENNKINSIKKYISRNGDVFSEIVYLEEYIYNGDALSQIKKYNFFADDTPVIIETINKSILTVDGKELSIEEIV